MPNEPHTSLDHVEPDAGGGQSSGTAKEAPSDAMEASGSVAGTQDVPAVAVRDEWCIRGCNGACERCVLACPKDAISFDADGRPVINYDACSGCGICIGICDAFASTRVTTTDLHNRIHSIAERGDNVYLTCNAHLPEGFDAATNVVQVPCLACLPPELWALVLAEDTPLRVVCDLEHCASCERAGEMGEPLFSYAIETAEGWTERCVGTAAEAPQRENLLRDLVDPSEQDRRALIAGLVGNVGDIASGERRVRNSSTLQDFIALRERSRAQARLAFDREGRTADIAPIGSVKRKMPPRRALLLDALEADPALAARVPVTVSQTDCTRCTNVLACTEVCPTKARRPKPKGSTLDYDPRYCIACGLCVEACPHHAITLEEATAQVFLPEPPKPTA